MLLSNGGVVINGTVTVGCGMVAEGGGRVGDDVGGGNTTALVERQLQI